MTNAICVPSGDQAGCRSAYRSDVSGRTAALSTVSMYRSVAPPLTPLKTMCDPSGDQVGVKISSTPDTGISCDTVSAGMSKIVSIAVPSRTVASAN